MITVNLIIYFFIFIIGITFGSFFTLAVYRIPLGKDITHTRSFCPNCNHKLSFWDMIPVFSYIFLGGKCRYCHQKIRIRYLLLEIFSGFVFVLFGISIKLNGFNLNYATISYYVAGILYIVGLFIIAGIDKEKKTINNQVLLYILIIETLYAIYLYLVEKINVNRYVIYLLAIIGLMLLNNYYFKKNAKNNYTMECLILVLAMSCFTYEVCTILTITFALLSVGIYELLLILKEHKKKYVKIDKSIKNSVSLPFGFYLCVCNILMLVSTNIIIFYK